MWGMKVIQASDIVASIDRYLSGEWNAAQLEAWAERHEMAEDVEYADVDRETIANALFVLANPIINEAITIENALAMRNRLLKPAT